MDAVKAVHRHICRGYTDMVDADLSKYFDSIPHSELLKSVARRVVDRNVLRLIKMWLKAPIEERDKDGTRRISGGKGEKHGTPQGGVASPLLANIYMNRFLKYWRLSGCGEASALTSSLMPMTSSSSAAVARRRRWRGRRR